MKTKDTDEILNKLKNKTLIAEKVDSGFAMNDVTDISYFKYNETDAFAVVYADPLKKGAIPSQITIPSYYNNKPVIGIAENGFDYITNLQSVYMGQEIRTIANNAFLNCINLNRVTINSKTVPEIGLNIFMNTSPQLIIYVPQDMVDLYKEDNRWSIYKDRVQPISGSDIPVLPEIPTIATNNGSVNVVVPTIVNSSNITIINKFYFNRTDNDIDDLDNGQDNLYKETVVRYDI